MDLPIDPTKMIVDNTQELRERAGYFEPLELGKVEVPARPYLRELIDCEASGFALEVETLFIDQLQEAIGTASYFDFRVELKVLVDEFLWRIGSRHKSLERYLKPAGTERYVVYTATHRGHRADPHYKKRYATLYSVRRDIEPITLRDALVSVYPKPFVGAAIGIRARSGDSLLIAYYGNLRLTKWWHKRHGKLGYRFAQNTVSVECLRYAHEQGVNITKFPIHTSDLDCEKHLLEAGARFAVEADQDIAIEVAIYRSNLEALKRIFARHPFKFQGVRFCVDIDIFRFVLEHSSLETVKQWSSLLLSQLGIEAVDALLARGLKPTDLFTEGVVLSTPEVVAHLHSLGVRWKTNELNYFVRKMSMKVIEKLTELGQQWNASTTETIVACHDSERFRYFNVIAPLTLDSTLFLMRAYDGIKNLETAHKGGCVHLQKGSLPPRPHYISYNCMRYIHEHIDPDY